MQNTLQPIVFFGTEDFSAISLQALLDADFPVALVVTKPDTPKGRGHKVSEPQVKKIAQQYGIKICQPRHIIEITEDIESLPNPLGVLVSFGKIIPASIINLFSPGIINLHPSLLPKYRGPSPIEAAILHGDEKTGVTIMQLDEKMDTGPVYAMKEYALHGNENQPRLYEALGKLGSQLLCDTLIKIAQENLQPTAQDHTKAIYCQLIKKTDGEIKWNRPSVTIERTIRAYSGWPKSHTTLGSLKIIIRSVELTTEENLAPHTFTISEGSLLIGTQDTALAITSIQPIGKKEMPIQAFLAGYKDKLQS